MKYRFAVAMISAVLVFTGCSNEGKVVGRGELKYRSTDVFKDNALARELAEAAGCGDVKAVAELVAKGAQVDFLGKDQFTPLLWSAWANNFQGFSALLEHGANPSIQRSAGKSLMVVVAEMDDPRFLEKAVAHRGDINLEDPKSGNTPLIASIIFGQTNNAYLLIAAGANINFQRRITGETPAMIATSAGPDFHLVLRMLQSGYDSSLTNRNGQRLADYVNRTEAMRSGDDRVIREKILEMLRKR